MRTDLDFDHRLARLPVIDDQATVARLLAPAAGEADVRRQDTKYDPGVRCLAGYEVRSRDAPPSRPVMGAVLVTPDDVVAFPLDRDSRLVALADALDPAAMSARLSTAAALPHTVLWRADPVRYKPWTRCVIRYEAETAAGTTVLYGKLLADGSTRQAAVTEALRVAARDVEGAPLVAPVVGVWPELGLLVQPAVRPAIELHGLVGSLAASPASRAAAFLTAGTALAALHSCQLPEAPRRAFLDDVGELRGYRPAVAFIDAATGVRYAAVVDALEAAVPEDAPEAAVTSHGAFRSDQLMAGSDRLVMIDLDTICRSEPARDIGNLLAYLDWKAIRRPEMSEMLRTVQDRFLAGYARRLPLPPASRVAVNRAASLVKIAGRRYRSLAVAEWRLVPSLLAVAERLATARQMEPT